ncbi:hypothetical protein EDB85DRAFT_2155640 [Lactarius pseudohatsudake]|nr:hypothetical protein EDB85DRAFT_2155640 [Lactarius pseudohatsudake]
MDKPILFVVHHTLDMPFTHGDLAEIERSPDDAAHKSAQRIDGYLRTAWERVEDLDRTFEPWDLGTGVPQIEADGTEDIDWRISLLQDAIYDATHRLTRRLPGISFSELKRSGPFLISEVFDFPLIYSTPITPQLLFSVQQIRALSLLSLKFHDVLEGLSAEGDDEMLADARRVRVPLRRAGGRQLWPPFFLSPSDNLFF